MSSERHLQNIGTVRRISIPPTSLCELDSRMIPGAFRNGGCLAGGKLRSRLVDETACLQEITFFVQAALKHRLFGIH